MSESDWYMQTPEEQVFGPVDRSVLDRWVSEGRVTADCRLRHGEDGKWHSADAVYKVLAAPPSPAAGNPFADGPPGATGRYVRPHRGGLILALGIIGWVVTCPIVSAIAWSMGTADLRDMRAGRMDRDGMGLTQAGQILRMIYTCLWLAGFGIGFFLFVVVAFFDAGF